MVVTEASAAMTPSTDAFSSFLLFASYEAMMVPSASERTDIPSSALMPLGWPALILTHALTRAFTSSSAASATSPSSTRLSVEPIEAKDALPPLDFLSAFSTLAGLSAFSAFGVAGGLASLPPVELFLGAIAAQGESHAKRKAYEAQKPVARTGEQGGSRRAHARSARRAGKAADKAGRMSTLRSSCFGGEVLFRYTVK